MSSVAGTQPLQAGFQWLKLILDDHKLFRTFINDRIPGLLASGDKDGLKAARDELSARLSAHTSAEERTYQSSAPAELYAEVLRQDAQEKAVVDRFMSADYSDIKAFTAVYSELQVRRCGLQAVTSAAAQLSTQAGIRVSSVAAHPALCFASRRTC